MSMRLSILMLVLMFFLSLFGLLNLRLGTEKVFDGLAENPPVLTNLLADEVPGFKQFDDVILRHFHQLSSLGWRKDVA